MKYIITITEVIDTKRSLMDIISGKPAFIYCDVLKVHTDNNIVAEVAKLAEVDKTAIRDDKS